MSLRLRNEFTLFEIVQEIRSGKFDLGSPKSTEKLLSKIGDSINVGGASYFIKSNTGFLRILKNLPDTAVSEKELNECFFDNINGSVYLLPSRVNYFTVGSFYTSRMLASYTASAAMLTNNTNAALNAALVMGIFSEQQLKGRN